MKKPLSILLLIFFLGLVFYGCNEEPTLVEPETNNAKAFFKLTEELSPFQVTEGSGYIVAGTGLVTQPGTIYLSEIPSGATVKQVLLYWSGAFKNVTNGDNIIEVDGTPVLDAESIGGPTPFFLEFGSSGPEVKFETFRKDITELLNWGSSPPSSVAITGMTNNMENNGAGMLIIYDDGTTSDIQLFDGQDLAYNKFATPLDATVPITFTFAASTVARPADLGFFVSSVKEDRPNVVRVSIGGVPLAQFNSIFGSLDDPDFDSPTLNLVIPAGVTSLKVQCFSEDHPDPVTGDPTGLKPASLNWITAALSIDEPQEDPGCTRTQGYWKTHSFYGPAPYDPTWENLLNDSYTNLGDYKDFFLSGQSYYDVMWFKARGNAYYKLAIQYVAAILNDFANAEVPSDVAQMISDAEDLFNSHTPNEIKGLKGNNSIRQQFIDLGDGLDAYNNGYLGVPHCNDGDDYGSKKGKKKK